MTLHEIYDIINKMENYPSGLRENTLCLDQFLVRTFESYILRHIYKCQCRVMLTFFNMMDKLNLVKKIFKDWNIFEFIFLIVGVTIETVLFIVFGNKWYGLVYTLLYFLTALLMAKRKRACCLIGIISTGFYAMVAYYQRYYGEMIVALLFTLPLMIFTLITWSTNKDELKPKDVKPNTGQMRTELIVLALSQVVMSVGYYFLLRVFNTDNLILSVLSVAVSFVASWLTMRRSNYMFIAYVINDIVLIILWLSPLVCGDFSIIPIVFGQFLLLINDAYGFIVWTRKIIQEKG